MAVSSNKKKISKFLFGSGPSHGTLRGKREKKHMEKKEGDRPKRQDY